MIKYALAGLAIMLALSSIGNVWLMRANGKLELENVRLGNKLKTCVARRDNLLEDAESDNEVDTLTDDELRNVPDGWLLPEAGAGD